MIGPRRKSMVNTEQINNLNDQMVQLNVFFFLFIRVGHVRAIPLWQRARE